MEERAAIARLHDAIATIGRDLSWYWRWGDGQGGYVLDLLADAVRDSGETWPLDRQVSEPPKYIKKNIPRSLSKRVFERDEYRCVTCGTHLDLTCDHILAESKGGETSFDNLQTMCRPCNSKKGVS